MAGTSKQRGAALALRKGHFGRAGHRLVEPLERRLLLATYTVNVAHDRQDYDLGDGICDADRDTPGLQVSLRAAIQNANLAMDADVIAFDLPSGSTAIRPLTDLPAIAAPLTIDGYTQLNARRAAASAPAQLLVELCGGLNPTGSNGLHLRDVQDCTITGLVINGFPCSGIRIDNGGHHIIEGNYIGTDPSGTQAHPNKASGVVIVGSIANRVGGTDISQCNIISGNQYNGVVIGGPDTFANVVQGNYIGVDRTGTMALPNTARGVRIVAMEGDYVHDNLIGGHAPGAGNLISGNTYRGVEISGAAATSNRVEGNLIGTDLTGTLAIPNLDGGILIDGASGNVIGGLDAAAGNVVSGNGYCGVVLWGDANHDNLVQGNLIGTDRTGTRPLANAESGVFILAIANQHVHDNIIGGTQPGSRNIVSANAWQGVVISGIGATDNRIQGNFIGTDITGKVVLGNGFSGVAILPATGATDGAVNNLIGGSTPEARNIISGNGQAGVAIVGDKTGSSGNRIQGNYLGLDVDGIVAIPNANGGVHVQNAPGNSVGGLAAGEGNVIAGNGTMGVSLQGTTAVGNQILGNWIGLNSVGLAQGNQIDGVSIEGALNTSLRRNVISGNGGKGVTIHTAAQNTELRDNLIGTNSGGIKAIPNALSGVLIANASNNVIGDGNIISGNGESGIVLSGDQATGNIIYGSRIGLSARGEDPLPNGHHGVLIVDASHNTIGRKNAPNRIAHNAVSGVSIRSGTGNTVRFNEIFENGALGLDLESDGESRNDGNQLDADLGANELLDYPILTHVVFAASKAQVRGYYHGRANATFTLDFYLNDATSPNLGEGREWLGEISVSTDADGYAIFDTLLGGVSATGTVQFITATATDADGNTSEFSHDADWDGLMDSWEVSGIPITNHAPYILRYASPFHKDLFVEADSMQQKNGAGVVTLDLSPVAQPVAPVGLPAHLWTRTVLDNVAKSFYDAPVTNPDGRNGIDLHVTVDDKDAPAAAWGECGGNPGMWPAEADTFKNQYFGTQAERNDPRKLDILAAKSLAYRYCIFADSFLFNGVRGISGLAEASWPTVSGTDAAFGTNDFLVTLGEWAPFTGNEQAGTFMHELGHTLGLRHGGADHVNNKPNYYGIMNYTWQMPVRTTSYSDPSGELVNYSDSWRLDYSRGGLNTLDENALNELNGIGGNPDVHVPIASVPDGAMLRLKLVRMGGFVDFNRDNLPQLASQADLNSWDYGAMPSPGEVFTDFNDWANIQYGFLDTPHFTPGTHAGQVLPDITPEFMERFAAMLQAADALPTAADDAAHTRKDKSVSVAVLGNDSDTDGTLDPSTLLVLVPPSHGVATINPDGTITYTPETGFLGEDSFRYAVRDNGDNYTNAATVHIDIFEQNQAPTIGALTAPATWPIGTAVPLSVVSATDVDGSIAAVRFYRESNGVPGLQPESDILAATDVSGADGWSALAAIAGLLKGSCTWYALAVDDQGALSPIVNAASTLVDRPVLQAIPDATIDERMPFTFTALAVGRNGTAVTYSLSSPPSGATIHPATGVFTWIPTENQGGATSSFWVVVRDGVSGIPTDSRKVTLTVNKVNSPPILDQIYDQGCDEGSTLTLTVRATDADLPKQTITYSLAPDAPAGAMIDPVTGKFTWTPPDGPADVEITVIATDNGSPPAYTQQTFSVYVRNVPARADFQFPWATPRYAIAYVDFPLPVNLNLFEPGMDTIISWQIDWGDGTIRTIPNDFSTATHVYTTPGDYVITSSITDEDGTHPTTYSPWVKVKPRPAAGGLDPYYGDGGTCALGARGSSVTVRDVLLQSDGKLILAGQQNTTAYDYGFGLSRFTAEGSPDTGNFGRYSMWTRSGCQETMVVPHGKQQIESIILQGSKIVAAGWAEYEAAAGLVSVFALARYDSYGDLDRTFNGTGTVATDIPGVAWEHATAVATLDDGRILAAGDGRVGEERYKGSYAIVLSRYNSDGSPDSSFGNDGIVVLDMGPAIHAVNSMAILPDGRILLGGRGEHFFAMVRLNPDGTLDASFGTGGVATADLGTPDDILRRFAILPDGRILAVGSSDASPYMPFGIKGTAVMAMFTSEGQLDSSFATQGWLTLDFGGPSGLVDIALQPDGQVVVCGWAAPAGQLPAVALARLDVDGKLDTTFGVGGKIVQVVPDRYNRDSYGTFAGGVAIAPDGRILVGVHRDFKSTGFDEYIVMAVLPEAPSASPQIAPVSPDPRDMPLPSATVNFGIPVAGMDLSHFTLTRDAGTNLLGAAQRLTSWDLTTFTLEGLSSLTTLPGTYHLTLHLDGLIDLSGHALTGSITRQFIIGSVPVTGSSDRDDVWIVRRDPNLPQIHVFADAGATLVRTLDADDPGVLEFQSAGGNDSIVLDCSNGSPFPANGLLISAGDLTLSAPGTHPFPLSVGGRSTVHLAGSMQLASLNVLDEATVQVSAGAMLCTDNLWIDPASTLDLVDGCMVLCHTDSNHGHAKTDTLTRWLLSAVLGGTSWESPGLTSLAAKNDPQGLTTLAIFNNDLGDGTPIFQEFNGQAVDAHCILVKCTRFGDCNLDGQITGDDYALIDVAWQSGLKNGGWLNGDINCDGEVTGDDYALMDMAWQAQGLLPASQVSIVTGEDPESDQSPEGLTACVRPVTR